ncbi:MAG TPA: 50S ribosomal protein L5 [Candidatus Parcubacteria bacterium]|nr:50S ribosomal protein L5 [Candidatus Parcubacteria bacterium]
MLRLKEKYKKEIVPAMMEKFGYENIMMVPKFEKVVINTSFGKIINGKTSDDQRKTIDAILNNLSLICGQRPVLTKARKSVSSFKVRKGMNIGAMVVLRKKKMYDFLDRLINIALPRSRDFHGIKLGSFDQKGNLTIPIKEHIIFPEISPEEVKIIFGFEITVATTAKNKEEGAELMKLAGFPIKK